MIREIRQDDLDQCVVVIQESFDTVAAEFGLTEENAPRFTAFAITKERLNRQLNCEHRLMYGSFDGQKLVGYFSLLLRDKQECELSNLCVLPAYRHRKLGQELLETAFDAARKRNCKQLNIGIVEENQVLRRWYEGFGFLHVGTEKFDFFPFTCGYMTKEL